MTKTLHFEQRSLSVAVAHFFLVRRVLHLTVDEAHGHHCITHWSSEPFRALRYATLWSLQCVLDTTDYDSPMGRLCASAVGLSAPQRACMCLPQCSSSLHRRQFEKLFAGRCRTLWHILDDHESVHSSNPSMKPMAPLRTNPSVFATDPAHGLSLSR